MDRLMELLNDGRAWSVADLANSLREPQKEVQRRVESLESNGYLRKACGCGPQCKGCGHCGTHSPPRPCLYTGTPVTGDPIKHLPFHRQPRLCNGRRPSGLIG